jgi:transposase
MERGGIERKRLGAAPAVTIGLDISDSYTQCCLLDGSGEVVGEERIRTTTVDMQRRFSVLAPARVVLEVGTHSPWVSRLLTELGHQVVVANSRQVQLIARSHRKSDRADAEQLARLGRLDPDLLAPIQHRSADAHGALATVRSRDVLVRSRTQLINHVRGTVKSWGGRLPRTTAPAFHRKAAEAIPVALRSALSPVLEMIGELTRRITAADAEIEALCAQYPETAALRQVVGVGPLTALTYVLTIEDPRRFAQSRDVGPYLGLVPRRRDSGDHVSQLRISKAGDAHLRRLLVNCAHYILGPFGPDSDLRRWGERYSGSGARNARKRALIAVARKLSVLLHALWLRGEVYEPLRHANGASQQLAAS